MAKIKVLLVISSILICNCALGQDKQNISDHNFKNFITAKGDKLFDGEKELRFISYNIPNLLFVEDPEWHFVSPWEQEDALKSIAQTGGLVARTYTLSVAGGKNNSLGVNRSHVIAPGKFDEEVFVTMDKALELANKYQIRLIIPFVDQWRWIGGIEEYAAFRGKKGIEFWKDPQIRDDFKKTIEYVLNRTNTFTGIKYKDDKAILCWETGNEIYQATDEWTNDIVKYIKSIDPNHLVMCGKGDCNDFAINNPLIDIVTSHYYNYSDDTPFAQRAQKDRAKTKDKKPLIYGEYGASWLHDMVDVTEEIVKNGASGGLIWSLRFRNEKGGFYFHNDGSKPVTSKSYHWPGFIENASYYEPTVVGMIRKYAFQIRNMEIQPIPIADAPLLLHAENGALTWRGSTGAKSYIVERSPDGVNNWELIATHVSDCFEKGPFYIDNNTNGKQFFYRIKAQTDMGISKPSNALRASLKTQKTDK